MSLLEAYDVFIFDCDSTLSYIEGIDALAALKGKKAEVAELTKQAMDGILPFECVLHKRLDSIRPTYSDLLVIGDLYIRTLVPGIRQLIRELHRKKKKIYIVSGGYSTAIQMLAAHLGIPKEHVYAIGLDFDADGNYLSFDPMQPLTKSGGKRKVIEKLNSRGKKIAFIGDSVADLEVRPVVDLFIGFGGVVFRQNVKDESDVYLERDFSPFLALREPLRQK